jgi:hypothetical protein
MSPAYFVVIGSPQRESVEAQLSSSDLVFGTPRHADRDESEVLIWAFREDIQFNHPWRTFHYGRKPDISTLR